jgi:hypothetical protein
MGCAPQKHVRMMLLLIQLMQWYVLVHCKVPEMNVK